MTMFFARYKYSYLLTYLIDTTLALAILFKIPGPSSHQSWLHRWYMRHRDLQLTNYQ